MEKGLQVVEVDFVGLGDFVQLGGNYLELSQDIPNEAIPSIFGKLKMIGGALHWYIGDFFAQIETLRGNELAHKLMGEWDLSYTRAATCKRVASTFEKSLRRPELSFSHHEEADDLCDSLEEALDLLELASVNKWSVAKMRQSLKSPPAPASALKTTNFAPVYDCARLFKTLDPKGLDDATRTQLKTQLDPIVKWHAQL